MTRLAIRLKLVAVLAALFLAIGGLPLAGYAQEDTGSSSAEQVTEPAQPAAGEQTTAEEPAPPPAEEPAPPPAAEASPAPAPSSPEPEFQAPVEEPATSPDPSESPAPSGEPASPEAPVDGGSDPAGETPAAAPAATEETEEVEAAVEAADEPAAINVAVLAVDCNTAPATVVPGVVPDGCTAASGLKFEATVGAVSLGTFTTKGGGLAQVGALEGEILTVTEDLSSVTDGYKAVSATSTVTVAAGAALTLVHVETDDDPIQPVVVVGLVQLIQGRCPIAGESRTELTYFEPEPESFGASADDGCRPVAGAEFQVTINEADTLAAAAVEGIKRTDANGNWYGELPVGSYIVTHVASGQSLEIEVVADGLSAVLAIDYVGFDGGTISIRRFACPGSVDTTEITVSSAEPTPRAGCEAEGGIFQLNDGDPFSGVDNDGAVTFDLPTGTYSFRDLTGGDSVGAEVTIALGATTWVMVECLMCLGDVTVQFNACTTPVSASEDPNNVSFWASACNNPVSGAQVRLISAAGEVVREATTDGGGYATFLDVASGIYHLRGAGNTETCAVFVGNQGALGGVQVSNGQFIQSQVFTCTKLAGGPIPGDPDGIVKLPVPGPSDSQNPTVTQLPSTGMSSSVFSGQHIALWIALIGAAAMALLATVFAVRFGRAS